MKSYLFIIPVLLMAILVFSCKDKGISPAATIYGKWNIINDAIAYGTGSNVTQTNYNGVPGDYFDFRNDGRVYVKEGVKFDTLKYTVISGYSIQIQNFGWNLNGNQSYSTINYTSPNTISIMSETLNIPSGTNSRSVNLSR